MNKRTKRGQALVETIVVLSIYIFFMSFIISGFQLMFNKVVVDIAAYEYARSVIAHESAKKYFGVRGNSHYGSSQGVIYEASDPAESSADYGKRIAKAIVNANVIDAKRISPNLTYEVNGIGKDLQSIRGNYEGNQHMYIQVRISGRMEFMFPILSADLSGVIADGAYVDSSYVMAKERIYNSLGV